MPLTKFQHEVLAVIVGNRSEQSHFAGGLVLNAAEDSPRYSKDFDVFHAMKIEWITISDKAEEEIIHLADTQLDMPIGVAFVDQNGEPGWIGANPDLQIHHGSLRGCWPTISAVE